MVRALVLALLGALLIAVGVWFLSIVPELTLENMDELPDDGSYRRLAQLPGAPLGLGVGCILASGYLIWRQSRIASLTGEHRSAIAIEVSVSKETRRELSSLFMSRDPAWSYVLLVREGSISLWAGLPPRPEVFIETAAIRTFAHNDRSEHDRRAPAQIVLEWNDGGTDRRLSVDPTGWGLRGLSAPPPAVTSAAVQRGRELLGLGEVSTTG